MNYRDPSSDENSDEYNSPLVSPSRPPPTRAGSPVELAVPTLSDNVDEELVAVSQTLQNVGHTHTFRRTRPSVRPDPEGGDAQSEQEPLPEQDVGEEEVVEGHVVESAVNPKVEAENGEAGPIPKTTTWSTLMSKMALMGTKPRSRPGPLRWSSMPTTLSFGLYNWRTKW